MIIDESYKVQRLNIGNVEESAMISTFESSGNHGVIILIQTKTDSEAKELMEKILVTQDKEIRSLIMEHFKNHEDMDTIQFCIKHNFICKGDANFERDD